jgi:hypothetical protein
MKNISDALRTVVMAKYPRAGEVKTRLVEGGLCRPGGAAGLAWAFLECTIRRLAARGPVVLAASPDGAGPDLLRRLALARDADVRLADQGPGDLGHRLDHVWRTVAPDGPIAFFGVDSPDVPESALDAIPAALAGAELAIGPAQDGGYWTLAARRYLPRVLRRIDWGGPSVYDQTCQRAEEARLTRAELPRWHDVDRPEDLRALRRRLMTLTRPAGERERPLMRLAERIDDLLDRPRL